MIPEQNIEPIENKVASSGLITLNLEDYFDNDSVLCLISNHGFLWK